MPMPDFSGKFPGAPWDAAYDAFHVHSSWWAGNTDALSEIYSGQGPNIPANRPGQMRGGVVGAVSRFWWGKPIRGSQPPKRMHIPAPADLATTSADLLFGQAPTWQFNEGDATDIAGAQEHLEKLLGGPDATATFLEAAEIQAALGGVFIRLGWDVDATDKVMISAVAPDAAIPEWRYGRLSAVTFWSVVGRDKRGTWRHLEYHEPGRIEHALFLGDDSAIGRRMPLSEFDATAWAVELVDENSSIPTGVKGLTAAYVPNVRPARVWRNVPELSALGRSDFEGLEKLFDSLDETWTSWMRDIEIAKGRLFVAQQLLEDKGPGSGSTFDTEQEIFTGVPADDMALGDDGSVRLVQSEQLNIRVQEHAETCDKLLKQILRAAGYSPGDFDDEMGGLMTATEVSARKDRSSRTRNRKALYWSAAMRPLARTMLELEAHLNGRDFGITAEPEMVFPVRVDQDPVQLATAHAALKMAQLISTETSIRERNPNWSKDEVDAEVQRILDEAPVVADPGGDFESDMDKGDTGFGQSDSEVEEAA